jgi:hypothetical protein
LGDASGNFTALACRECTAAFSRAGYAGLARLEAAATRLLEEARDRALLDDRGALARFEADIERFTGTPFEADLRAVALAWRESGHFPTLTVHK